MRRARKRQGDMRSLKHVITTFVLIALAAARPLSVRFRETTDRCQLLGRLVQAVPEEIPELNELNKDADIQVLGVNFDRKAGDALAVDSEALGLDFRNIEDPSQALGVQRPSALPSTLVISLRARSRLC